ncbi:MAG: lolB [Gammaproteobacteria bacterium]|jgi:outer membrane lipoprotein LolB|nr:lolB [Gammaproteobacteria bacterium]
MANRMITSPFKPALFFLCLIIAGCASVPPKSITTSQKAVPWETRKAQLEDIQTWNVKGSVSIQYQQKTDIASLSWQQRGQQHYNIVLSGPLNIGRVEITGTPETVTFKQGDKFASANTPETLMTEQLGWQIPVSNLYYWLRGLPAQGSEPIIQFDTTGDISQLAQQGWLVEYAEYMNVGEVSLPRKVYLSHPTLKVRLVIRQWILGR